MTERRPGEDLVAYYNRRLAERGIDDREWFYDRMGNPRLRDKLPAQSKLGLSR